MEPEPQSGDAPSPGFADLGLHSDALRALEALGFEAPTPIQAAAIPPLLEGRDVIGGARTGSGKTAAFGLPLLEHVRGARRGVRALVLAPTRELAIQVSEALRSFAVGQKMGIATVYGGSSYHTQFAALERGVPVVVGTPGRMIDLLERGALDLSGVEYVVLDEADEMLRMGFIDAVEQLLGATPASRQVALFSATMPPAIRRVASKYTNDPVELHVDGAGGPAIDHIEQRAYRAPQHNKLEALARILRGEEREATLAFARTKKGCAEVADALQAGGIPSEALHGDMSQRERERVVEALRSGRVDVVIATDVAARGIDVEHITHVVNLDVPDSASTYTHRIGRTGRAGRKGVAITLIAPQEDRSFRFLQQRLKTRIPPGQVPSDADIARRQQTNLRQQLSEALADADDARAWVEWVLQGSERSAEDLAAAAIALLAGYRGVPLHLDATEEPPEWSRPPEPRSRYERQRDRHEREKYERPKRPRQSAGQAPDSQGQGGDRGRGPQEHPPQQRPPYERRPDQDRPPRDRRDGPQRPGGRDEVELFIAVGRAQNVRPSDIVGSLTHDQGLAGHVIGRITIQERRSFVSLPRDVADGLLDRTQSIQVRGMDARIAPSRAVGPPQGGPPRGRGPGPGPGPKRGHRGKRKG